MIRIYLALQECSDGRIVFRRWSLDTDTVPGGHFQKQDLKAFRWLLSQAWNFDRFPVWSASFLSEEDEYSMKNVEPFEILP